MRMLDRNSRALTIAMLALVLSGCATSDDQLSRAFVAPGKFALYNCAQIAARTQNVATRERELQQLMAKASTDSAGRFISTIAYRPEYLVNHGELLELRSTAAEKNCRGGAVGSGQLQHLRPISETIIR